jgi:two-component system nitrate/nitrite response regulator NarL
MTIAQPRPTSASTGRPASISVLVADRQPLVREALVRAVRQQPRLQLVGEVADGRAALERIAADQPDVAVVDVRLPSLDGAQVLNAVVRDGLPTRMLLLSASLGPDTAYDAIAAGAAGLLSKQSDAQQVCDAVLTVARGEVALAGEAQTGLATAIRQRATEERSPISDRERDVLLLVADGLSAGKIGRKLHLSTGTVKSCLLKLYARLEVSDRAAAVAAAIRRGLIE